MFRTRGVTMWITVSLIAVALATVSLCSVSYAKWTGGIPSVSGSVQVVVEKSKTDTAELSNGLELKFPTPIDMQVDGETVTINSSEETTIDILVDGKGGFFENGYMMYADDKEVQCYVATGQITVSPPAGVKGYVLSFRVNKQAKEIDITVTWKY